ncbi:MAG TPA: hypothetical protein VFE10_13400 [Phenylobacterium sp.]|nr:hypothetical protein [Phenylobacterium sp.]
MPVFRNIAPIRCGVESHRQPPLRIAPIARANGAPGISFQDVGQGDPVVISPTGTDNNILRMWADV